MRPRKPQGKCHGSHRRHELMVQPSVLLQPTGTPSAKFQVASWEIPKRSAGFKGAGFKGKVWTRRKRVIFLWFVGGEAAWCLYRDAWHQWCWRCLFDFRAPRQGFMQDECCRLFGVSLNWWGSLLESSFLFQPIDGSPPVDGRYVQHDLTGQAPKRIMAGL